MAAAKKKTRRAATLLLSALVATPLMIAPTFIRGFAAASWISHYASLDTLPRPRKTAARAIALKTDLAVQNLAPLPQAATAAMRALDIGLRVEHQDHDREAALVIYEGVRASSARVRSRALSGTGFAVIEARATALVDSALTGSLKSGALK